MDLTTQIGQIKVDGVVGNSPGPRKELQDWHEVGKSPAGVIVVGSFTPERRPGNPGETFWVDGIPTTALNSLGLPAKSPEEYSDEIVELLTYGKPIIVSLAGFKPEDYIKLVRLFGNRGFLIELNLTCPNVVGKGIFAYDLHTTQATIMAVRDIMGSGTLIVKLNPHPDTGYIETMCSVLEKEKVDAVALCNTVPNCLVLGLDGRPVITPNNGLAGLSGSAIKPIVVGQVFQYRQRLPDTSIIAEGGIWKGLDIMEYFYAGANFCRTATAFAMKGARVFEKLTTEFVAEMERNKFESIADIPVHSWVES